jgi:hypothetical protein
VKKKFQVKIEIENYKMRKGFVKKNFGFLAGNDIVKSHVTVTNKSTGEIVGEAVVETTNATSSATLDDMANMHAKKPTKYLKGEEND